MLRLGSPLHACAFRASGIAVALGAIACSGEFGVNGGRQPHTLLPSGPTELIAGPADHAPTPFYVDPSIPPAGLDTEWKQLADGAGVPGPVWVRLTFTYPSPGAAIDPAPVVNGVGPPGQVFHYTAEACMDPVPNPHNNIFLSGALVRAYWSADGRGPINRTGDSAVQVIHEFVPNGQCVTMRRLPPEWGGTHFEQWVFFDPPGARYLMFAARYGAEMFSAWNSNRPDDACPPAGQLESAATRPACLLRSAHFLDYAWTGSGAPTPTPAPTAQYDGEWSATGVGTSSASTGARIAMTFTVANNVVTTLRITFTVDTAPGAPQSTCAPTSGFGGGRITDGAFSLSGGIVYPMVIRGAFTGSSASGTAELTPGPTAPAWCPSATAVWTATRQP